MVLPKYADLATAGCQPLAGILSRINNSIKWFLKLHLKDYQNRINAGKQNSRLFVDVCNEEAAAANKEEVSAILSVVKCGPFPDIRKGAPPTGGAPLIADICSVE